MRADYGCLLAMTSVSALYVFFFFQAEDGIRDLTVTGVQTCALPISVGDDRQLPGARGRTEPVQLPAQADEPTFGPDFGRSQRNDCAVGTRFRLVKIGRASCRERV